MLDAVLPGLPPVTAFLSCVQAAQMKPVAEGEADSGKNRLFGGSVASVGTKVGVANKSKGSTVLSAAVKVVEEFDAMLKEPEIEFKGLDEWFESLAMFVVDPEAMSKDRDVQTRILEKHKRLWQQVHAAQTKSPVVEDVWQRHTKDGSQGHWAEGGDIKVGACC